MCVCVCVCVGGGGGGGGVEIQKLCDGVSGYMFWGPSRQWCHRQIIG